MGSLAARDRIGLVAVAALGAFALAQHWLADRRPAPVESRAAREIVVVHGEDRGDGSLREAIFAAATAGKRVRIALRTPRVALASPLPPLLNPHGVSLEAEGAGCELDFTGIEGIGLEIRGARTHLAGVSIVNSPAVALLVAAPDVRISGGRIARNAEGVRAVEGAARLAVEGMRFEGNVTGLRLESAESAAIRNNTFRDHREAAVWLVRAADAPPQAGAVAIIGNRFEGDRLSVVAGNAPVAVERNEFVRHREAAVLVLGSGVEVRANQVRDGEGIGVLLQGAERATVANNDIGRNRALGVLVRDSRGATIEGNRVYANGYGMALVLGEPARPVTVRDNAVLGQRYDGIVVIGDSPVIRRNQSLNNGQAGLRVLDFVPEAAPRVAATPFVEDNRVQGNLLDEIVRGQYRVEAARAQR